MKKPPSPRKQRHQRAKKRNRIIKHLRRARKNSRMTANHQFHKGDE